MSTAEQDTRLLTTSYPYVLYVWFTDLTSHGGRNYWKEMARCETSFRAIEVADLLRSTYRCVRVDRLKDGHFSPYVLLPNERVVEQQTDMETYEPLS